MYACLLHVKLVFFVLRRFEQLEQLEEEALLGQAAHWASYSVAVKADH